MHMCRPFPWALLVATLLIICPRAAAAASCKGDKKLDVPMQFSVTFQSAGRVHLSAFGGADKSGWVIPLGYGTWRIYDASGRQLDFFTRADLGFASKDMLKEANLEGLVPGESYTIELASQDFCANQGTFRNVVTVPAPDAETNGPTVSTPTIVQVGGFGSFNPALHFSATDDTGIAHIAIYFNGALVKEYRYFDGVGFRWWCDVYPLDSVQSSLEGPNYYYSYPSQFRGTTAVVEIVVEDLLGNRSITNTLMNLF
jgi:hypothetical protein